MRRTPPDSAAAHATVFAALGDATRLGVVAALLDGHPRSIARLTAGTDLSRQAVSKHLRVLSDAGVIRFTRAGRETLYALEPRRIAEARAYLDAISRQWDDALARLTAHLER